MKFLTWLRSLLHRKPPPKPSDLWAMLIEKESKRIAKRVEHNNEVMRRLRRRWRARCRS